MIELGDAAVWRPPCSEHCLNESFVVFGCDFNPDAGEASIYITREDQIGTVSLPSIERSISHNHIEIRTSGSNFDEVRLSNPFVIELTDNIQLQESEDVPEVWSSSKRDLDAALKLLETIVRG